jgi:hypothetical protein
VEEAVLHWRRSLDLRQRALGDDWDTVCTMLDISRRGARDLLHIHNHVLLIHSVFVFLFLSPSTKMFSARARTTRATTQTPPDNVNN